MAEDQNQSTPDQRAAEGTLRKRILYGCLAILLVALAYDYGVARPAVNQAYEKIAAENTRANEDSTVVLTDTQVAKILGKQPSEQFEDVTDLVEVYKFAGGLPLKPHKLFVVYRKQGDQNVFYRHAKFVYDERSSIIPKNKIIKSADLDQTEDDQGTGTGASQETAVDEDQSGRLAGQAENGTRGGSDPEARFTQRDADGDGKLTGDEIPERMKQNLAEIDQDGDGAVSEAEMMKRLEQMRARFGEGRPGRGPSQDGEDEGAPRRPPLEQ